MPPRQRLGGSRNIAAPLRAPTPLSQDSSSQVGISSSSNTESGGSTLQDDDEENEDELAGGPEDDDEDDEEDELASDGFNDAVMGGTSRSRDGSRSRIASRSRDPSREASVDMSNVGFVYRSMSASVLGSVAQSSQPQHYDPEHRHQESSETESEMESSDSDINNRMVSSRANSSFIGFTANKTIIGP